jgi:hypothetical protein
MHRVMMFKELYMMRSSLAWIFDRDVPQMDLQLVYSQLKDLDWLLGHLPIDRDIDVWAATVLASIKRRRQMLHSANECDQLLLDEESTTIHAAGDDYDSDTDSGRRRKRRILEVVDGLRKRGLSSSLEKGCKTGDVKLDDGDDNVEEDSGTSDEHVFASAGEPAAFSDFQLLHECSRVIRHQRDKLRARAMELSRPGLRKISLLDLPMEILYSIIGYIDPYRSATDGLPYVFIDVPYVFADDPRKTRRMNPVLLDCIRRMRLACRTLCQLVTPYLCPILVVQFSQDSLQRAMGLLQNPAIASGLRGLWLDLRWRPRVWAENIGYFLDASVAKLVRIRNLVQCDDPSREKMAHKELLDLDVLTSAWRRLAEEHFRGLKITDVGSSQQEDAELSVDDLTYFRQLAVTCHRQYIDAVRLQEAYLTHGDLLSELMPLVAKTKHPLALRFTAADPDKYILWDNKLDDIDRPGLFQQPEKLLKHLVGPVPWDLCEREFDGEELMPVEYLATVPMVADQLGVRLREVHYHCFPAPGHFETLFPIDTNNDDTASGSFWTKTFQHACRNLEMVVFLQKRDQRTSAAQILEPIERVHLDTFVKCLLKGTKLKHFRLDLDHYLKDEDWPGQPELGAFLEHVCWPDARSVVITNVILRQAVFVKLCRSLGPELERFYLHHVFLQNGSCIPIIDIMRARYRNGNFPRLTDVALQLCNFELVDIYHGLAATTFDFTRRSGGAFSLLHDLVRDYVFSRNAVVENPFAIVDPSTLLCIWEQTPRDFWGNALPECTAPPSATPTDGT